MATSAPPWPSKTPKILTSPCRLHWAMWVSSIFSRHPEFNLLTLHPHRSPPQLRAFPFFNLLFLVRLRQINSHTKLYYLLYPIVFKSYFILLIINTCSINSSLDWALCPFQFCSLINKLKLFNNKLNKTKVL